MAAKRLHEWRTYVYQNSLYSEPIYCRDISPSVFNQKPEEVERLTTWIVLDVSSLGAMFTGYIDNAEVKAICSMMVKLVKQISIESIKFKSILASVFHQHTSLFIHELLNFVRSPYNSAIAYQCYVQYRCPVGLPRPCTSRAVLTDFDQIFTFEQFLQPGANDMMSRTNKRKIDNVLDQDELAESQGPAKKSR